MPRFLPPQTVYPTVIDLKFKLASLTAPCTLKELLIHLELGEDNPAHRNRVRRRLNKLFHSKQVGIVLTPDKTVKYSLIRNESPSSDQSDNAL